MFGDLTETPNQSLSATAKNRFFRQKTQNDDIELQSGPSQEGAVVVKNAFKNYGSTAVLKNFTMKVPKGTIYALLGASGCGKTTLLSCLVGRRRLISGHVSVLGDNPGSKNLTSKIGYMPQETGLHRGFTIKEIMIFFGRVLGMQTSLINERTEFLVKLLMLPKSNHNVSELSGGEQRRVSLAIAFLHEPELLILDEPTVGTDPIAREVIWKYFLDITTTKNVTIIITTHYIQETSQADTIGFMRGGYLVAEDNPKTLLKHYKVTTLEDVFLKLSVEQNENNYESVIAEDWRKKLTDCFTVPTLKLDHLNALTWKHCLWVRKNFSQMIVVTILPVLIISLFYATIGRDPINLKIAVVNGEMVGNRCNDTVFCDSNELSCSYLKNLEQYSLILLSYQAEVDAIESVERRDTYASIVIKQNYSKALRTRAHHWYRIKANDLEQSTIEVYKDVSNKYISQFLEMYLLQSYETFFFEYVDACDLGRKEMSVPLQLRSMYHGKNPNFTDFCTPSVLLSVMFLSGLFLSASTMLLEKNEASLERTLVVGVNKNELLLSHAIVHSIIVVVQTVLLMTFAFAIFGSTAKGSLVLVGIMMFLIGFAGICFGLLISCLCDTEAGVTSIAIGFYFPILFTSGLIWPIEAMHPWLKPFSIIFPLTKPAECLRFIMHRGWEFFYQDVYVGFLIITVWSLLLLIVNVFFLKL
ncbi:hypothetical protein FQR65_LT14537 [Abscondita terminalis]|nr:hypothetical protein FQR65_LT14537 [Abscondita terminalis]